MSNIVGEFLGLFGSEESNLDKKDETIKPWTYEIPEQWVGRETELKNYIMSLSSKPERFRYSPPKDYKIKIDKDKQISIAKTMLKLDKRLSDLRDEMVPKL
jgi:hypothetical protein